MGKITRYIIVAVLVVFYFLGMPDCLYTRDFPALLVHPFFHANIFHLLLNCLAIWTVFDPRTRPEWWYIPAGIAIASASYVLASQRIVGFSTVLFAVAGLRTPSFRSSWWRSWNCWAYIGTMILMFFLPMFAAKEHLICFTIGVAVSVFARFKRKLEHDTRRAKGNR